MSNTNVDKTYKKLLEIRKREDLKVQSNPYLKEEYQLRYYQIIGMLHMFMVKRFILGDDTGIGKTLQTIATFANIKKKDPDYKLMIICPSSVMYQWRSEIDKFCNNLTTYIVESKDIKYVDGVKLKSKNYITGYNARKFQFEEFKKEDRDVVIFNYNTLSTDYSLIKDIVTNNKVMVVFDECTAFKNTKTNTHENARQLSKIADRVYGLSATIIKNDLVESYAIFRVIMPYVFGTLTEFKKNYCILEKKQLWKGKGKRGKVVSTIVGYKNLEFFKKVIDPYYLGRKKSHVAKDLPEIISKSISFDMDKQQERIYQDALNGLLNYEEYNSVPLQEFLKSNNKEIKDEGGGFNEENKKIDKLTALMYCQQIVNSPYTLGIDAPSAKESELLRIVEDEIPNDKVVIYSRFKKMVNRLEDILKSNLGVNVLKITGDIDNATREEYKNKFNNSDDHNIMLINSAAKEGINLQSSGYLIFYDLPFSYGDFLQIIGRIHRIGSEHSNIFLMYLLGRGTVDEKTYEILYNKKDLFDKVLGDSAVGAIDTSSKANADDLFIKMMEYIKKTS